MPPTSLEMRRAETRGIDYLQRAREVLLWKLEGLSEYDIRRPLTPTGTNLLGIVKHVAGVELEYFGPVFGRPTGLSLPWASEDAEPNEYSPFPLLRRRNRGSRWL